MSKEQKIQKLQAIQKAITGSVGGLTSIYNFFDGRYKVDGDLKWVDINDGHCEIYENEALGLKDFRLPEAVLEAHNTYVYLLLEWQERTGRELTELLKQ